MTNSIHIRSLAVVCALVAITTTIAGCGGSHHLSHTKVVSEANAACRHANTAVTRVGTPVATLPALSKYAGRVLVISRKLISQLDSLNATTPDKTALRNYTGALKTGNHGLMKMQRASSPAEARRASQLIAKQNIPQLADKLGAKVCAEAPSA